MDLAALPTIVIAVNVGCCGSCREKLGKLLWKAGVESFDIAKDECSVTIKGDVDPQYLVKNIAKALHKKKAKLLHYELPKEEDSADETEEEHTTKEKEKQHSSMSKGKEKAHSGMSKGKEKQHSGMSKEKEKQHSSMSKGKEKQHSSMSKGKEKEHSGMINEDLHSTHHYDPNFNHFGPPNPHYPPPRGPPRQHHYEDEFQNMHHGFPTQRFDDVAHHYQEPYFSSPMQHNGDVAPRQQYGNPYPREFPEPGPCHVSSTNSAYDYFSDENATGCTIM